jgi:hypothetical protein
MDMRRKSLHHHLVRDALLLTWISGTALFFFLRFTLTFHHANEAAIREVFHRLFS